MMAMTAATFSAPSIHNATGMTSIATSAESDDYRVVKATANQTTAKTRTMIGATPSNVPI